MKLYLNRLFARMLLVLIDICLAQNDVSSRDLWSILSALRGPDDQTDGLKESTTIYVRRAAFPRTARKANLLIGASFDMERPFDAGYVRWTHFGTHIRQAIRALYNFGRKIQ